MVLGKIAAIILWIGVIFLAVTVIQEMHKLTVKPGYYTDCHDKEGNVIQNTTCWDKGTTQQDIATKKQEDSFMLIFLGGLIAFIGYGIWMTDEWM